jgi:hypothetical protein
MSMVLVLLVAVVFLQCNPAYVMLAIYYSRQAGNPHGIIGNSSHFMLECGNTTLPGLRTISPGEIERLYLTMMLVVLWWLIFGQIAHIFINQIRMLHSASAMA